MKEPRLFTREEAERTLPLVQRIVRDLMLEHPAWRRAVARYEVLAGAARPGEAESAEMVAAQHDVEAHASRIEGYLGELQQVGCVFKGFEDGLVDFYALRDDRLVFLCWRYGEDRITHWHELDAGAAGRQPLADVPFTEIER
ncbi:MAG TPA: DUF2203 domain-containing protein [Gemmatimonadales bacterium]|nr:DUF2203 domain-containing protein [Gemmatimonadales bacterium]